jgi:outer membrane biosynthesis protein TonB
MIKLTKKRFILPACVCCLCAPSVLLASPGELDEITIRVIDNDDILPGSHALILPVNEDVHEHNKISHLENKETWQTKKTSAEYDSKDHDHDKKGDELNKETEHSERHDKSERHDELEHPEHHEHHEYTKEVERPEQLESPEHPEKVESPELESPEQPEKVESPQLESAEQPEDREESEHHESTERRD